VNAHLPCDPSHRISFVIREEILSGKRKFGEFLPAERTFSQQYGINNKAVREGLDILVSEQLIEKIPRVGNRVVQPERETSTIVQFAYQVQCE
jgi:multiple sugar transport system substrate-binding protein